MSQLEAASLYLKAVESKLDLERSKGTFQKLLNKQFSKVAQSFFSLKNFALESKTSLGIDRLKAEKFKNLNRLLEAKRSQRVDSVIHQLAESARSIGIKPSISNHLQDPRAKALTSLIQRLSAKRESAAKLLADISIREDTKDLKSTGKKMALKFTVGILDTAFKGTLGRAFEAMVLHSSREAMREERAKAAQSRARRLLRHLEAAVRSLQFGAFSKLSRAATESPRLRAESTAARQLRHSFAAKQAAAFHKLVLAASQLKIGSLRDDLQRAVFGRLARRSEAKVRECLLCLENLSLHTSAKDHFLISKSLPALDFKFETLSKSESKSKVENQSEDKLSPFFKATTARQVSFNPEDAAMLMDHSYSVSRVSHSKAGSTKKNQHEILEKLQLVKQRSTDTLRHLADNNRIREMRRCVLEQSQKLRKAALASLFSQLKASTAVAFAKMAIHGSRTELKEDLSYVRVNGIILKLAKAMSGKMLAGLTRIREFRPESKEVTTETSKPILPQIQIDICTGLFGINLARPDVSLVLQSMATVEYFPSKVYSSDLNVQVIESIQIKPKLEEKPEPTVTWSHLVFYAPPKKLITKLDQGSITDAVSLSLVQGRQLMEWIPPAKLTKETLTDWMQPLDVSSFHSLSRMAGSPILDSRFTLKVEFLDSISINPQKMLDSPQQISSLKKIKEPTHQASSNHFTKLGFHQLASIFKLSKVSNMAAAYSRLKAEAAASQLHEQIDINAVHCQRLLTLHGQLQAARDAVPPPLGSESLADGGAQQVTEETLIDPALFEDQEEVTDKFALFEWYSCPARAEDDWYCDLDPVEVSFEMAQPAADTGLLGAVGSESIAVELPMAKRIRLFGNLSRAMQITERSLAKLTFRTLLR